jgi:hypothetical protein
MHETEKKLQVEFGWKFDEIMGWNQKSWVEN